MKERLKELRKSLGMTQDKFASRIGLSRNFITQIEIGSKFPSDRTISDICREFNVNEHWLRTGEGSPTKELSPTEEVEALVRKVIDYSNQDEKNPFYDMIIDMMKTYHDLDPESQLVIQNYFNDLRLAIRSKESDTVESEIDKKVAKYRQELELEARQTERLSVYKDISDANRKHA